MPFPTLKVIAVGQRGYPPAAMTRGVINGKVPPLSNSAVASPTLFYSDSPEAIRQGPLTAKSRFKCIKIPVRPPPAPPPPPPFSLYPPPPPAPLHFFFAVLSPPPRKP